MTVKVLKPVVVPEMVLCAASTETLASTFHALPFQRWIRRSDGMTHAGSVAGSYFSVTVTGTIFVRAASDSGSGKLSACRKRTPSAVSSAGAGMDLLVLEDRLLWKHEQPAQHDDDAWKGEYEPD